MKKAYDEQKKILESISIKKIVELIEVKRDMAYKIKTGKNLPSLKRAVILENNFGIECSFWIEHQKRKKEV